MSRRSGEPDPTPGLRELHAMVRARLARHDSRYTPGRRRLVKALMGAGRPVTLTEIASSAPDLPISSTYRNLSVLERSGVVNRILIRGDRACFELAEPLMSHHHHLVCIACGAITDIHLDDELEEMIDLRLAEAARRAAFTPLRHMLDLHGHCSRCLHLVEDSTEDLTLEDGATNIMRINPPAQYAGDATKREFAMAHVHTDTCYDHPEHTHADHADHCDIPEHSHADHADHCGMAEHSHADHCDDDHDHADHCDIPEHSHADHADHCGMAEHSHADHADHCDIEEHIHTEECCNAA